MFPFLKFLIMSYNALTLKERIVVLEFYKNPKFNDRKLAEHLKIGKIQAAAVIKNKEKLKKNWYENGNTL